MVNYFLKAMVLHLSVCLQNRLAKEIIDFLVNTKYSCVESSLCIEGEGVQPEVTNIASMCISIC